MNDEELKETKEKDFLRCPICNEILMYMEPDGSTLYCKKCDKFFKNENGTVGEETTDPYPNKNVLY